MSGNRVLLDSNIIIYLAKGLVDINDVIKEQIVKAILPLNPTKIILFGSYAYGVPTINSDIDICVVKESKKSRIADCVEIRKKLSFLPFEKDIIVENSSFLEAHSGKEWLNSVWYDIVHEGEVLYEKG